MLKNLQNKPYFYKITNLINDKFYYGSGYKNNYAGSGKLIHLAYKKYGIENFKFEILKYFDTREEAYLFEDKFLKLFKIPSLSNSYNIKLGSSGGDTFTNNPNLEKIKIKLKESFKEYYKNHDRLGTNNNFYGKKHTQEYKNNVSERVKGSGNPQYRISFKERIGNDEEKYKQFKEKISNNNRGEKNPRYGKSLMSIWIAKYGYEEALIREKRRVEIRKQNKLNKLNNG